MACPPADRWRDFDPACVQEVLVQTNWPAHAMCDDTGSTKNALDAEGRNGDEFVRAAESCHAHHDVQQCQGAFGGVV